MANIPWSNNVPPPAAPHIPTAEEKAALNARDKWGEITQAPKSLAKLILLVNEHPEWLEWAKASQAGTMKFS